MKSIIISIICVVLYCSCTTNQQNTSLQLKVETYAIQKGNLYLEMYNAEKNAYTVVDSITINAGNFSHTFTLTKAPYANLYKLKVLPYAVNIPIALDQKLVHLNFDFVKQNQYKFYNSITNTAIKLFLQKQIAIVDSLKYLNNIQPSTKSTEQQKQNLYKIISDNYHNFCDTTNSIESFIFMYDFVSFGNNTQQQLNFLNKAEKKFNNNKAISVLKSQFLVYKNIFDKELNVFDTLPNIKLINTNKQLATVIDNSVNAYDLHLINFKSTFCGHCYNYEKDIEYLNSINSKKITLTNIWLDADIEDVKKTMFKNSYTKNLIDTLLWQGEVAKNFYIDSIPYNMLVSKKGVILAKAIKPKYFIDTVKKYFNESTKN